MKEFDYYIFIDYSEFLLGYGIIEKEKIMDLIPLITRFRHYKNVKNRKMYLKNINKTIKSKDIKSFFSKIKIKEIRLTPEIYVDIADFVSKHDNCAIFVSIDDNQYNNLKRLVNVVDGKNILIKKESELKTGSVEYQTSLVIDNILNIERIKYEQNK
ncbi:MAG: hypothetical protein ACOCUU_02065 [Nanoarchaeota archaeon]